MVHGDRATNTGQETAGWGRAGLAEPRRNNLHPTHRRACTVTTALLSPKNGGFITLSSSRLASPLQTLTLSLAHLTLRPVWSQQQYPGQQGSLQSCELPGEFARVLVKAWHDVGAPKFTPCSRSSAPLDLTGYSALWRDKKLEETESPLSH